MSRFRKVSFTHRRMLMKTGSYYLLHIVVAAAVAYAVTGNLWAAITLSLLEPTVQAVAYFFHEKAWTAADRKAQAKEQAENPVEPGSCGACVLQRATGQAQASAVKMV
jgi:uncharacterized membrane protein